MNKTRLLAQAVKAAAPEINQAQTSKKNQALKQIAEQLLKRQNEILKANQEDLERAEKNGMPKPMLDRLLLDEKRIKGISDAVLELVLSLIHI